MNRQQGITFLEQQGLGIDIMKFESFGTKLSFSLDEVLKLVSEANKYEFEERLIEQQPKTLAEIIEFYGLKLRTRKQIYVYNRVYLANYLRNNTRMSLVNIGLFLGVKHDTVIYYLNQFNDLKKDIKFIADTFNIKQDLKLLEL